MLVPRKVEEVTLCLPWSLLVGGLVVVGGPSKITATSVTTSASPKMAIGSPVSESGDAMSSSTKPGHWIFRIWRRKSIKDVGCQPPPWKSHSKALVDSPASRLPLHLGRSLLVWWLLWSEQTCQSPVEQSMHLTTYSYHKLGPKGELEYWDVAIEIDDSRASFLPALSPQTATQVELAHQVFEAAGGNETSDAVLIASGHISSSAALALIMVRASPRTTPSSDSTRPFDLASSPDVHDWAISFFLMKFLNSAERNSRARSVWTRCTGIPKVCSFVIIQVTASITSRGFLDFKGTLWLRFLTSILSLDLKVCRHCCSNRSNSLTSASVNGGSSLSFLWH